MSTIVLVHGALQTAGTWDRVAPLLRQAGHRVFTPALSGMGPQGGPLTPDITLDTHIADIVRLLERYELHDVVLAGHSYSGMVITGAAVRAAARVAHLVYVDAFVPEQGESAFGFLPEHVRERFRASLAPDGYRIVPSEPWLDVWHLEPGATRDFVRARFCDWSIRCFEQPLREDPRGLTVPRTFIACVAEGSSARAVFAPFAERARRENWGYHELPTGHDCQAEMPDAVAEIIGAAVPSGKPSNRKDRGQRDKRVEEECGG